MKLYSEHQKNRVNYHNDSFKNTVHRSSLIAPRINNATTNISFLNHFLIKRNYDEVMLKITSIKHNGRINDSVSILINKPIVYSIYLEALFEKVGDISEYLIEFYSSKNLFIPFPAVMVNHIGEDFINSVHSFNRVLNDIFEDDSITEEQAVESLLKELEGTELETQNQSSKNKG